MANSFVKLIRSEDTMELMKKPREFMLLTLIAYRAKRTIAFNHLGLEIGEALIGDHQSCGLTERQYRTAKKNIEKWEFATFKATNKGTIAKLLDSRVYDINIDTADNQFVGQSSDRRRTGVGQATTNKNIKKNKNEKEGGPSPEGPQRTSGRATSENFEDEISRLMAQRATPEQVREIRENHRAKRLREKLLVER